DVRLRDAFGDGPDARLELGDHPGVDARQQVAGARGGEVRQERVTVGPGGVDPVDVGEDDQLVGPQGDGQGCCSGVGVDIEDLPVDVQVGSDRRHDRDATGVEDVQDCCRVDRLDIADQTDVHGLAVDGHVLAPTTEEA